MLFEGNMNLTKRLRLQYGHTKMCVCVQYGHTKMSVYVQYGHTKMSVCVQYGHTKMCVCVCRNYLIYANVEVNNINCTVTKLCKRYGLSLKDGLSIKSSS